MKRNGKIQVGSQVPSAKGFIMLFIGSTALKIYVTRNMPTYDVPVFGKQSSMTRPARDIDIMGTYEECMAYIKSLPGEMRRCYPIDDGKKTVAFKGGLIIEAEIAWEGSSAEEFIRLQGDVKHASLNGLYALKMSHRYLRNSPAFMKTMRDIQFMRRLGAIIPAELQDWFKAREDKTYWYQHPSLNHSKKDFFKDDNITYVYDHDTLHLAVKHLEMPAYEYFRIVNKDVLCSREKFDALPIETRLYATLEESYVLALERSQIPFPGQLTPRQSFLIALKKVCSSITSGWFREFSWEHYDKVDALYNNDYLDRFQNGIETGLVKPF